MVFERVLGQRAAVESLCRALQGGRVHHAYLFEGPEGVGKELTAFAYAQCLLCPTAAPLACGDCTSCKRVITLGKEEPCVPLHPDLVLVGRGLYSNSVLAKKETNGISVEQIRRVVLPRCAVPPHEGRNLVIIVRDAHELTQSAANALLKTLEEPPTGVHFVLLTHQPRRLLDTIRSRTMALRFRPLDDDSLEQILVQRGLSAELARLAQGSASSALEQAEPERRNRVTEFTHALSKAAVSPSLVEGMDLAAALPKSRQAVKEQLLAFAENLADQGVQHALAGENASLTAAAQYEVVQHAILRLERNGAPALVLEGLVSDLRAIA